MRQAGNCERVGRVAWGSCEVLTGGAFFLMTAGLGLGLCPFVGSSLIKMICQVTGTICMDGGRNLLIGCLGEEEILPADPGGAPGIEINGIPVITDSALVPMGEEKEDEYTGAVTIHF